MVGAWRKNVSMRRERNGYEGWRDGTQFLGWQDPSTQNGFPVTQ